MTWDIESPCYVDFHITWEYRASATWHRVRPRRLTGPLSPYCPVPAMFTVTDALLVHQGRPGLGARAQVAGPGKCGLPDNQSFATEDRPMARNGRHWYITMLALLYVVLCSSACLYYASLRFRANPGAVPLAVQLLCLGMAISAGIYFIKPHAGRRCLFLLTVVTLIAIGTSDAQATCFHLAVLAILLIPEIGKWKRPEHRANNGMQADRLSAPLQGVS